MAKKKVNYIQKLLRSLGGAGASRKSIIVAVGLLISYLMNVYGVAPEALEAGKAAFMTHVELGVGGLIGAITIEDGITKFKK